MTSVDSEKKEESEPTSSLQQYYRPLAFAALFLAVALLLYVIFAPSSPMKLAGGKRANPAKTGGCGCSVPGYGDRY